MNDIEIINKVLNGNKNQYAQLMEKYHNEMFSYIYNITADYSITEDIVQEVFIKVYTTLDKYNQSKASFRTWLYKVASNHTINVVKSKDYRSKSREFEYDDNLQDSGEDIYQQAIKEEQITMVHKAMVKLLKPKHLRIMQLHFFSNLTVKEISESLNIPDKTIYKAIQSSIQKIKMEVNIDE